MKQKNGITLIVLIITIIVLLILAGVSSTMILGSNGLLSNYKLAIAKYKNEQTKEEDILINYEKQITSNSRDTLTYDSNMYDVWITWLQLAGINNVEEYNEYDIVNNVEIVDKLMNNAQAVEYLKKSKYFLMPAVCSSNVAVIKLLESKVAVEKILADETWFNSILNSKYANELDKIAKNTPKMSSLTNKVVGNYEGEVIGNLNSTAYGRDMFKAFDKEYTTRLDGYQDYGCGNYNTEIKTSESWIGYHFTNTTLKVYKWEVTLSQQALAAGAYPKKVQLCGSNDGVNYTAISNVENILTTDKINTFYLDSLSNTSYAYIIVKIIEGTDEGNVCIDEIEFYGI